MVNVVDNLVKTQESVDNSHKGDTAVSTQELAANLAAASLNEQQPPHEAQATTTLPDVWWTRRVKPEFPAEDPNSDRTRGLGYFALLVDGLIQYMLLNYTEPADLCALNATSKAFYITTVDQELWRKMAMKVWNFKTGRFPWKGRWKETALTMIDIYNYEHKMKAQGMSEEEIENSPGLQEVINRIPRYEPTREIFSFDSSSPLFVSGFNAMLMHRRWYKANFPMDTLDLGYSHLERRSAKTMTVEEFKEVYEKGSRPVLITDLMDDWPAMEKWSEECLLERFGSTVFKLTHKHAGCRLRMKIADYFKYWKDNKDHDPLYLFESNFARKAPPMKEEFKVPKYFEDDLLQYVNKRPFERWTIIGPPRSGTSFHTDPLSSSAWNALISGRKRWALYPPNWPSAPGSISYHPDDKYDAEVEPSAWLLENYPFLAPEYKPWECVQRPGEVIFVPAGWWHMVLNIDWTVAVTQNFVTEHNLEMVWDELQILAEDEPDDDDDVILLKDLREKIRIHRPDQFARILQWEKEEELERQKAQEAKNKEESGDATTPRVAIPPLQLASVPDGPQNWIEQPADQIYPSSSRTSNSTVEAMNGAPN
eukprot:TRINITY_DN1034_c0_g1_i3.p1 TRINITY_DN1034_c0_g1~~TRINITY_DN1034_c0_g1_i3.p1  ORF type:complete len:594 (+),score=141.12 TRINITY_DN1034_c0_g1_i3:129-1910(+)